MSLFQSQTYRKPSMLLCFLLLDLSQPIDLLVSVQNAAANHKKGLGILTLAASLGLTDW